MFNLAGIFNIDFPVLCARFVMQQISKKIIITILFINKNLSNFYYKRIFSCSASLYRGWKEVLNAVFDFIYNKLKKSALPIISKKGFNEKNVFVK